MTLYELIKVRKDNALERTCQGAIAQPPIRACERASAPLHPTPAGSALR